jgi:hypothetical protein
MTESRFPSPWTVEKIAGGLKVCEANGQSLAYVYARESPNEARIAKVLTEDEAGRISENIAKLPMRLKKRFRSSLGMSLLLIPVGLLVALGGHFPVKWFHDWVCCRGGAEPDGTEH